MLSEMLTTLRGIMGIIQAEDWGEDRHHTDAWQIAWSRPGDHTRDAPFRSHVVGWPQEDGGAERKRSAHNTSAT